MAERTVYKIPDTTIRLFVRGECKNLHCRFSYKGNQYKNPLETTVRKKAIKLAKDFHEDIIKSILEGRPVKALTFKDVADRYIEKTREEFTLNGKSLKSFEHQYTARINRYFMPFLENKHIHNVTTKDISRYVVWRQKYYTSGPGKAEKSLSYNRSNTTKAIRASFQGKQPTLETIGRELSSLKQIFVFAQKEKLITSDQVPTFELPKDEHIIKATFETFEIERITEHLNQRLNILVTDLGTSPLDTTKRKQLLQHKIFSETIEIALATGMRPVEMEKLTWKKVLAFKNGKRRPFSEMNEFKIKDYDVRLTNVFGKTHPRDVIPMKRCAHSFYELWKIWDYVTDAPPKPDDPILFTAKCKVREWPTAKFARLLKELDLTYDSNGKKRTAYSLRHYAITEWYKKIGNIEKVAQNVGNKPDTLRKHYDHVTLEHYAKDFSMDEGVEPNRRKWHVRKTFKEIENPKSPERQQRTCKSCSG